MNYYVDVDHQLIKSINLGLVEQVSCSPALAGVPRDSRLIDYQLLRLAVQRNETEIAQLFIDRGFRVNPDTTGCDLTDTPLHFAVERRNGEILQLLLKHFASVEHKNERGLTALQTAVKLGNFAAVDTIMRELKSRHYLQRLIEMEHLSTLHAACLCGDVNDFNRVLECGISIKEPVSLSSPIWPGCTNLHLAVVSRSLKLMELSILRGIDTKAKDIMNLTALQLAAKTGDKLLLRQLLRLYIDHEVDLAVEDTDGMTYLHYACTLDNDSVEIVRAFLKKGVNVHATTSFALSDTPGYTALHFAVKHGNFDNVQELMKYGANPTVKNSVGETPLHLTGGHPETVAACFKNYQFYDVDTRDRYGTSHFHIACLYGRHEIVGEFIKRRSVDDINMRIQMTPSLIPYHGSTPLHLALRLDDARVNGYQQAKVVCKLLESPHIYVNARDSYGQTALHIAVMTGDKHRSVETLIRDDRIDVNTRNLDGQTALHLAVKREDMLLQIHTLLRCGADMYAQDQRGRTPLHVAHKSIVQMLLYVRYPPEMLRKNPCDTDGISIFDIFCENYELNEVRELVEWFLQERIVSDEAAARGLSRITLATGTALHAAAKNHYVATVRVLLRFGLVNGNVLDENGATALHVISAKGYLASVPRLKDHGLVIAQILVDAGVDIEATTFDSKRTALHEAARYNVVDIIQFLLKRGANLSARDEWQNTPLHLAVESCSVEAAQMLIGAGADVNARNESGAMPLHKVPGLNNNSHRSSIVYMELIDILLYTPTSHCKIDAKDKTGMTPLCIAFEFNNSNCIKAFLEHGADPEHLCHRMAKLLHGNKWRYESTQMIVERMIGLRVAGLLKDKTLANLPGDFGMLYGAQGNLEEDIRKELSRMGEVKVDPYTTLRDLMYKSDIALRPHLANDHLRKMLGTNIVIDEITEEGIFLLYDDEYPYYGPLVRRTYRRALLRLGLMQEANKALKAIAIHVIPEESAAKVLPEPCVEAILDMVDDDDNLRNLVEAVYHKKM